MLKATFRKHLLQFKRASGTSRGILKTKNSWIIEVWEERNPLIKGIGEASIIENLSPDWDLVYENKIKEVCENIANISPDELYTFPSIRFAIEMALADLKHGGRHQYFINDFTRGYKSILINGLIWMGEPAFMQEQIQAKLEDGFRCIKLKIGAIDFNTELKLLAAIREHFDPDDIELRVDANGAFDPKDALYKLEQLAAYDIHSIEQPIQQGQWRAMSELCEKTPLPIALDEELIGVYTHDQQERLLDEIQPQYIILKPSLLGGFKASDAWIDKAEKRNIGWWITSALESNIGLNAIAQYTFSKNNPLPQGLGTGQLYTNNIENGLILKGDQLWLKSTN